MKVLFLDHDGVICLDNQWGSRTDKRKKYEELDKNGDVLKWGKYKRVIELPVYDRFDDFNAECVDIINSIIIKTDCQIVVSSDWRELASVEEMGDYYESQGIIRRPLDFTPIELPAGLKFYSMMTEPEETRSYQILQWLSEHPEVTHWVAIDDLDMRKVYSDSTGLYEIEWGLYNFVHTIGIQNLGINQEGKADEVIGYLTEISPNE